MFQNAGDFSSIVTNVCTAPNAQETVPLNCQNNAGRINHIQAAERIRTVKIKKSEEKMKRKKETPVWRGGVGENKM